MIAGRALIVGFGVTGQAMAAGLHARGADVLVADDEPSLERRAVAQEIGVTLIEAPANPRWPELVASRDAVLPAPGLPESHPVFAAAADAGVPILSEFDLAAAWDDRPLLAVTGTDGKTTVTTMVTEMLEASGRHALAVGNTPLPLVTAIDDPTVDVFVVEASSFRLGHTRHFAPAVATWLNFAADHLDRHVSLASYEAAKARIWADLTMTTGVAILNADDPTVARHRPAHARCITFGLDPAGPGGSPDYRLVDDALCTPGGEVIVTRRELFRTLPHDVSNALAAAATALEGGADINGVRAVLRSFHGLPHRVELVGSTAGVRWYDDSKATAPHATLAALRGFDSVVLIAGGQNKGLDLSPLAGALDRVRAVVAIGEAAVEVEAAFHGHRPVVAATSMDDAVEAAATLAEPGDAVLLSPGCASFDWFSSYAERGDAFSAAVRRLPGTGAPNPQVLDLDEELPT